MSKCSVKILCKNEYTARLIMLIASELDFKAWMSSRADGNMNVIDSSYGYSGEYEPSKCIYLCESGEKIPRGIARVLQKPFLWDELRHELCDMYEHLYTKFETRLVLEGHELISDGKSVILTDKEAKLFKYLQFHADRPVSRKDILSNVWKSDGNSQANITDVYINYLRSKIRAAFGINVIRSVRSVGYMYTDNYTQMK
ncbi:MAG: winged helix-turn-helix transcriptional regulator [Ruminococcaceae bacterium]|nr:winged helix-turn-helix transcriptional regulator [Oscillospiraceae bacterium]